MANEDKLVKLWIDAELNHYMGNYITPLYLLMNRKHPKVFKDKFIEERKLKFLRGLKKVIEKGLPSHNGITNQVLQEICEVAESADWTKKEGFNLIIKTYDKYKK